MEAATTQALTCFVFYTCNGEQGQFRRSYRFPALAPFAMSHRVVQLDRQLLVECLIENATEGSIYLSSWRLDCAEGFQQSLLEGEGEGAARLLKQRGCHSLVFQLTPESDSVDSASVRLREMLGTLALYWQVPDGPRGCMEGHEIQVKVSQVLHLDLSVVECPRKVKVETPFRLELQVTNRTSDTLQPKAGDSH